MLGKAGTNAARPQRGVRIARLCAIKADIVENFDRDDLSIGEVAARHRVTPRCVQLLFEGEGTTFTAFLHGLRLARARQMLRDPRLAGRTIISIAFDVGFGDLSYFNRTFRRHFGASPSEVRGEMPRAGAIEDTCSTRVPLR